MTLHIHDSIDYIPNELSIDSPPPNSAGTDQYLLKHRNIKYDCKNCLACQTLNGMNDVQPQRVSDDPKYTSDDLLHTNTIQCTYNTLLSSTTDITSKRNEIRDYFHRTFTLYEQLFSVLHSDSTYYLRPDVLRHPLIFYYGHTAVFFINKLIQAGLIAERINESIESTCAIGVDEMSWDDLNESNYNWPSVQQLTEYRDTVRQTVDELIQNIEFTVPIDWNQGIWIVLMGIEHERIHLETSSVLFRQLPINEIHSHTLFNICENYRHDINTVPQNRLIPVQGKQVRLGRYDRDITDGNQLNHDGVECVYGWDNEYGVAQYTVQSFHASQHLVTNAEYYKFWLAGGYTQKKYWSEEGWEFIQYQINTNQRDYPLFWVPVDHKIHDPSQRQFKFRTMCNIIDMPWDWPVETNYLESYAYCQWFSEQTGQIVRLPTEAEYMCMRDEYVDEGPDVKQSDANINLNHYSSSCPVDEYSFTSKINSRNQLYDVIGNVWQHSETPIYAFQQFKYHDMYDDFSIPTFDTRHNLLLGGSWISTGNECMKYARYAFRRHFYQHAGFRYIVSNQSVHDTNPQKQVSLIESDPIVVDVLQQQYNDQSLIQSTLNINNWHVAVAQYIHSMYNEMDTNKSNLNVLDVNCGTGRTIFELLSHNQHNTLISNITGIDRTTRFIQIATQLQEQKYYSYKTQTLDDVAIDLNQLYNYNTSAYDRIVFMQANSENLDNKYKGYDLILNVQTNAATTLDTVLSIMYNRLNTDGILVYASNQSQPKFTHTSYRQVHHSLDIPCVQHITDRQYNVQVYTLIALQKQ